MVQVITALSHSKSCNSFVVEDKVVELVDGGFDINGATPSSFSVSVLLLASVKRFCGWLKAS